MIDRLQKQKISDGHGGYLDLKDILKLRLTRNILVLTLNVDNPLVTATLEQDMVLWIDLQIVTGA